MRLESYSSTSAHWTEFLLYSTDELCRYVAARLKYRSACYSSSKLQWSGGILRCLNGMDCYLLFPVVSVRLLIVSEHRWLTLPLVQAINCPRIWDIPIIKSPCYNAFPLPVQGIVRCCRGVDRKRLPLYSEI